ncbi:MAG TPA: PLP-dependent lyase/thiolase [Ilumatobacter sp.]
MITGLRCAVCGAVVDVAEAFPWRCPLASDTDPYHVLHLVDDGVQPAAGDDPNPFVRYGPRLAWWSFATARGLTPAHCEAITRQVAGDFRVTPFGRSAALSAELGVELWVKDETGNVAGSHKARHLVGILLHLLAAEALGLLAERPRLAIASCGNAALAAATLAARAEWPLDVFVPDWVDAATEARLVHLGAGVQRCERRAGDPPGDPAMLRFREARRAGAIPFTVQGPENALCLDGGRTIGWEIADQAAVGGVRLDRIVVQVGGGAFAACVGAGLGHGVRLDTVQAAGCAPLADAWERVAAVAQPARYWPQVMRPWPDPHSAADGILDDETYDWIADVEAMVESGGEPLVAAETEILRANELATAAGFRVSHTGSAGLAGVLAARGSIVTGDRIAVIMSGVAR